MEIKEFGVTKIVVQATPKEDFEVCVKKCLMLAVREWQTVEMLFDGKSYIVYPRTLLGFVQEEKKEGKGHV